MGKHWENWTANQHIIRVVPASKDIAGYLSIFLASDYGYPLITHYTYGSVVDEIDDTHVRSIPFPLLKDRAVQKQINDLALQANEKRYEAYQLEQQALKIMDKEVIFADKTDKTDSKMNSSNRYTYNFSSVPASRVAEDRAPYGKKSDK